MLLELAHDRLDAIRGATDPDPLGATRADADPSDARRRGWRLAAAALEALATCLRRADHVRRDPSEPPPPPPRRSPRPPARSRAKRSPKPRTTPRKQPGSRRGAEARRRRSRPAEAFEANLPAAPPSVRKTPHRSRARTSTRGSRGEAPVARLAAGALERAGLAALGEAASAPESAFARGPPNSRRSNPRHSNPSALHPGDAASAFALAALSRNCAEPRVAAAALAVFERCSIVRTDEADAGDASLSAADGAAADDPVAAPLASRAASSKPGGPRRTASSAASTRARVVRRRRVRRARCPRAPNEPRVPTDEEHPDEDAPGAEVAFEGDENRRPGDDGRVTNRANAAERRANAAAERRANAAAERRANAPPPPPYRAPAVPVRRPGRRGGGGDGPGDGRAGADRARRARHAPRAVRRGRRREARRRGRRGVRAVAENGRDVRGRVRVRDETERRRAPCERRSGRRRSSAR